MYVTPFRFIEIDGASLVYSTHGRYATKMHISSKEHTTLPFQLTCMS